MSVRFYSITISLENPSMGEVYDAINCEAVNKHLDGVLGIRLTSPFFSTALVGSEDLLEQGDLSYYGITLTHRGVFRVFSLGEPSQLQ